MIVSTELIEHLLTKAKSRTKRKIIPLESRPDAKWASPIAYVIDTSLYTGNNMHYCIKTVCCSDIIFIWFYATMKKRYLVGDRDL